MKKQRRANHVLVREVIVCAQLSDRIGVDELPGVTEQLLVSVDDFGFQVFHGQEANEAIEPVLVRFTMWTSLLQIQSSTQENTRAIYLILFGRRFAH